MCLPKPRLFRAKKTKSRTELVLQGSSAYLIKLGLDGKESPKPRLLAIVRRSLV